MAGVILVGDIGGTNTRFALAQRRGAGFAAGSVEIYGEAAFGTFGAALSHYLAATGAKPEAACMAVAGPPVNGTVHLTHRNWTVSEAALKQDFGIGDALVVNDFVAMARSVPELGAGAFEPILEGDPVPGAPILVAGPGTGFGVATLIPEPDGWAVLAGEGGHMAYAPRTPLERELAAILTRDHGYVSNELVASGSGLPETYAAFCEIFAAPKEALTPAEMRSRADGGDKLFKALIETRALAVMGAAGDLALATGAMGGVVLAGGVSERISDYLKTPEARERFRARGPRTGYLQGCPVRLLRDPLAPLIGAAAHFSQLRRL
jgi:glucokinase